jgi:hypothetical protein
VVLWPERTQNEDVAEWLGEWPKLRWSFYNSKECESDGSGRVAGDGGADSMFQFELERGGDRTKRY